jgi:DNA invertase Pin-like site-specific DNA recombinase
VDDLKRLVKQLTDKAVTVEFVKEGLKFHGDEREGNAAMSELMLNILGAVAQFEHALICERRREGIALAKKRGVYKGRKPALTKEQVQIIKNRAANHENKSQIARDFDICRETLYRCLRR